MAGGGRVWAVAAGAVTALSIVAHAQTSHWRNSEKLWTHILACTSQNPLAHNNLGAALVGHGQIDEALAHYRKALEIRPDYVEAHCGLGVALADRGEVDEALAHYRKALEIEPGFAEAHNDLANALADRGQVDEAIAHYQRALEIKPDYPAAHYNLGAVLAGHGRLDEAIEHYQKALSLASAQNDSVMVDLIKVQLRQRQSVAPARNRAVTSAPANVTRAKLFLGPANQ